MFIEKIAIKNFRIFSYEQAFEVDNLNIPDGQNEGSGLTLFVGENGLGKTSLLDALALPILPYKAENFSLSDIHDPTNKTTIEIFAEKDFKYKGTMPKAEYKAKGFVFDAGVRARENRAYLSSIIVSDQRYIRADGESKPEDGKPDLRLGVNNPWSGTRFNENDILFLDKNRTYQTRSGTYNTTRFDRLMEDFDYQYIKQGDKPLDCNEKLSEVKQGIENAFITNSIEKFKEISGQELSFNFIENWRPFSQGFFGVQKENKQIVSLKDLGSGYEMIFSLLYSFYLAQQSGKQLIILIDEPELHLHPKLQEEFVKILLEFSKIAQIILTTHSPLFVKQILENEKVQVHILKIENNELSVSPMTARVLPYISANEINFVAFNLPTEEYHNELFEALKNNNYDHLNIKDFDLHFFQNEKKELANYPYKQEPNQVSIHTHLRTQIHHRGKYERPDIKQIKSSIEKMRTFF